MYRRAFSSGLVLVNPTSSTHWVDLGSTYIDLEGNTVTSVSLEPHTGKILRTA